MMRKYRIKRASGGKDITSAIANNLNPEQGAVVEHKSGPMLVLAGAGTGKTTTVTYRVAKLVSEGVHPEAILLLTFTNKAAGDMMKRVEWLIGDNIRGMWGGTFHHLCNMVLRKHADEIGYSRSYTIMDREDTKQMIKDCVAELGSERILPKPAVITAISGLSKSTEQSVEDIIETRFFPLAENGPDIGKVLIMYEEKKRKNNLMDFDDLLLNARTLLDEREEIRDIYRERFVHILVDEYQDTNHIQSCLVDTLSEFHRNLMVVGDDAQSIYSFRGADFENIIKFPDRYHDVSIFKLTTNYRSTPDILELANDSISHNSRQFKKELRSVKDRYEKPGLISLNDVYEQSSFVVSKIYDLIDEGSSLKEIAVLYRSHYQSMELQMELQRRGLPFEVRSGLRFFEQAHIKDIISYLRILINPHDELSWKRVLNLIPGIGNATSGKIFRSINKADEVIGELANVTSIVPRRSMDPFLLMVHCFNTISGDDAASDPFSIIEEIMINGYEQYLHNTYPNSDSRAEDIEQVRQYATSYSTVEEFVSDLSLQGTGFELTAGPEHNEDAITLSTVHQAKGLEWGAVFVIGLNDGRFPSRMALKDGDEEEERRLFYVASTRAKRYLYLCYTLTGSNTGGVGFLKPSRFIEELDTDLYERIYLERY